MAANRTVRLQIASLCEGQRIEQDLQASLYVKGTHLYYRYNETDANMGHTMTTLKVEPDQIRIIRHGDIQSEQTFALHNNRAGFYQTAQGKLELSTFTHTLALNLINQVGTITWSYDLHVSGELSGTYLLTAVISEVIAVST
jgi:uncharacterized beta-barrel protein YwiB (DUF1934 family)